VSSWIGSGTPGNIFTINSLTPGTQFTLNKIGGVVSADYLSITDSNATPGSTWYAGNNSTNVSNNTGWIFTGPPGGTGSYFLLF
jgi:L-ascorbate metabolism protein UlaG (beta-lactamase superfamily)